VSAISVRSGLIILFVLIFGSIIGPVNLFWFAGGNRRARLFWTTPLISLIGTAVLIVMMVVQDGFGGSGARVSVGLVLPEQNQMIVVQQQLAKTGVLMSSSFDTSKEATWLWPLRKKVENTAWGRPRESDENRSYGINDGVATGEWFTSRSVQGLLLHSVRMSRGGLEFTPGEKPTALSSLSTGLGATFVYDAEGKLWAADQVRTGERTTLREATSADRNLYRSLLDDCKCDDLLWNRLDDLTDRKRACFFAVAEEPAKVAVPTLESVVWNQDRAFVAGRYVEAK
jgi:hypothetical protein